MTLLKYLPPAYFALVMATGIVSIAAWNFGLSVLSAGLFAFNLIAYGLLAALTALRAFYFPRLFLADMTDHRVAPGFFTTVAASCIIGVQFSLLARWNGAASAFLALGAILWAAVTYAVFLSLIVKTDKPPLNKAVSGLWLVAVVATQSVAELATLVAQHRIEFNFVALSMWLWGVFLYGWIVALLLYRYVFLSLSAEELSPAVWINMGAMAISTLAGARLIESASEAPFLAAALPFLHGLTIFCWAAATWWAPILLGLSLWRVKRVPLSYDPSYWAAVFPLGMYSAATWQMAKALNLPFLNPVAWAIFWVALAAWSAAFVGMLSDLYQRHVSRSLRES